MIRHIVMWKFKENNKKDNMDMFKQMLLSLKDEIDEIKSMTVGEDINDSNWDMALVIDVVSLKALSRYKNNPKHKLVSEFCMRIRDDRASVDFEF